MRRRGAWASTTLVLAACVEINPAFYDDGTGTAGDSDGETAGGSPLTCENLPDSAVFCSDFEEGSKEIWDDYDPNSDEMNVLTLDPGPRGATDNHVMRLRIPPGPGGVDLVKLLPGYYDALYTRWYVKYEPGYDFSAGGLGSGLHAGERDLLGTSGRQPTGADWFAAITSHTDASPRITAKLDYRGQYQDCASPDACYRDTLPCLRDDTVCTHAPHRVATEPPVTLQTDRWYCVEMFVDAGTPVADADSADGQLGIWVDGAPVGQWNDLWFRTDANLKLNVLWLLLWYGGDHGDEGVLYDDVVVSRERIGCL